MGTDPSRSTQLAAFDSLYIRYGRTLAVHWSDRTGTPDIITFSNPRTFGGNSLASAQAFLSEIRGLLRYRPGIDQFDMTETRQNGGLNHLRFRQTYRGLPVSGGEFVLTVQPGARIQLTLGMFYRDISLNVQPSLTVQQALAAARQNPPPRVQLLDSLVASSLVVYPADSSFRLSWELHVATDRPGRVWLYVVNAVTGNILHRQDNFIHDVGSPSPQANVYLQHPYIDPSYSFVYLNDIAMNGYLQGTYADVLNLSAARAYNTWSDFRYLPTDTHFDEANLFYQITNFRTGFWNPLGFNSFTQIIANAHDPYDPVNAGYSPSTHQLYFGDAAGYPGFNDFAKEDKVIMHEYTHAVTDFIAHLSYGDNETGAISEGNSDYFAGTFTDRELINEYCCYGYPRYQRSMSNPRIATYSEYTGPNWGYPYVEAHDGGEFWSTCLWDLRSNQSIGKYVADIAIKGGLYALPTNASFLQYRQAIMNYDDYLGGGHKSAIAHAFFLREIGTDALGGAYITGPGILHKGQGGTWTAYVSGGSGYRTYQWYISYDAGESWSALGTAQSQYYTMDIRDFTLRCDIHDAGTGENASATFDVEYWGSDHASRTPVPSAYELHAAYPNPFNPSTQIGFDLPLEGKVVIVVYDVLGRQVAELVNGYYGEGYHSVTWDVTNSSYLRIASGVYYVRMSATGMRGNVAFSKSNRLLLMK